MLKLDEYIPTTSCSLAYYIIVRLGLKICMPTGISVMFLVIIMRISHLHGVRSLFHPSFSFRVLTIVCPIDILEAAFLNCPLRFLPIRGIIEDGTICSQSSQKATNPKDMAFSI